jgi:hypothetical protein
VTAAALGFVAVAVTAAALAAGSPILRERELARRRETG